MLSYYYDVLEKYVTSDNFSVMEMDTDSLYVALAGYSLDDLIVKDQRMHYFEKVRHNVEGTAACDEHRKEYAQCMTNYGTWVPRECCQLAATKQMRVPGLMKVEMSGCQEMVCLSSKSYFCKGGENVQSKYACKGAVKRQNNLKLDDYANVLETKRAKMCENTGFQPLQIPNSQHSMFTVAQHRQALSYIYCKRIVHDDGITTSPLLL